ncbi:MAG: DUF3568 family protein [Verrucomicrobia bacterium]|nr:DUF3568 family protein [Verrucomicrobiota bacterium]
MQRRVKALYTVQIVGLTTDRPENRSADFQSAVSPISNRQGAGKSQRARTGRRPAEHNSAIRQSATLRYELCRPSRGPSSAYGELTLSPAGGGGAKLGLKCPLGRRPREVQHRARSVRRQIVGRRRGQSFRSDSGRQSHQVPNDRELSAAVTNSLIYAHDRTWTATQDAISDLEFKVSTQQKDALAAKLSARGAGDKKIQVDLKRLSDKELKSESELERSATNQFPVRCLRRLRSGFD